MAKKGGAPKVRREEIEARAEAMVLPIAQREGFELVDVEYVKEGADFILRAYIDKPGGVNVDDCELVSRAFEAELDAADLIPDAYILEVSSPGLGRPLKKEKDYVRARGQRLEVHLFRAADGDKQFEGVLADWDETSVTLTMDDGSERKVEKSNLALIRLAFDF